MIWTRVESMCNFNFYHVTLFRLWYEVCTPHSTASFIYSDCHNVNLPLLMSCHIYYTGPFSWYAARANINRLELNIFCCILCRYCPPVFVLLLQATKNEQAKKAFPSRSSLLTATQASINKWHLFYGLQPIKQTSIDEILHTFGMNTFFETLAIRITTNRYILYQYTHKIRQDNWQITLSNRFCTNCC